MMKRSFLLLFLVLRLSVHAQQTAYRIHEEGQKLFNDGKYAEAIVKFDATIKADATYFEAYCDRARANMKLNKYDLAKPDLDKCVQLNAKYAPGFFYRAQWDEHAGLNTEAIADYSAAIKLNPSQSEAYLNRGMLQLAVAKDNYQPALDDLSKAISLDPKNAEIFYQRALCYEKMYRQTEALSDLNNAVTFDPNMAKAYTELGKINSSMKKYDVAVGDYAKAITLGSNTEEVYRGKAFAEVQLNKIDDAIRDYSYVLEQLHSLDADLWRTRGELFLKQNNTANALRDFNKSLAIRKDDIVTLMDRADTYSRMGKTKYIVAENDYKKVLTIDPKNARAARSLSQLYFDQEKWQAAYDQLDVVMKNSPTGDDYELRGKCSFKLNNKKAACEDFTKAESLGNKNAATDKLNAGCK